MEAYVSTNKQKHKRNTPVRGKEKKIIERNNKRGYAAFRNSFDAYRERAPPRKARNLHQLSSHIHLPVPSSRFRRAIQPRKRIRVVGSNDPALAATAALLNNLFVRAGRREQGRRRPGTRQVRRFTTTRGIVEAPAWNPTLESGSRSFMGMSLGLTSTRSRGSIRHRADAFVRASGLSLLQRVMHSL